MHESIGYETYSDSDAFSNGIEAQVPVENTVARGWTPYDFLNTNEDYELAKVVLFMLTGTELVKQKRLLKMKLKLQ